MRRTLNSLMMLAVIAGIGWYVWQNLDQLRNTSRDTHWGYAAIALTLTICGHMTNYYIWRRIAIGFDMHTSWQHAGRAWFASRLGRYLPGKIAVILIRFGAYSGHNKTQVAAASIVELLSSLCAASLLLLATSLYYSDTTPLIAQLAAALCVCVFIALSHTPIAKFTANSARRILPIPPLNRFPGFQHSISFAFVQLVAMGLHGGALLFAFKTIGDAAPADYLLITSAFFIAGFIGMLAFFSPSGIGVREGVLIASLSSHISAPTLIIGAVIIRIIGIISEILLSGLFFVIDKENQGR